MVYSSVDYFRGDSVPVFGEFLLELSPVREEFRYGTVPVGTWIIISSPVRGDEAFGEDPRCLIRGTTPLGTAGTFGDRSA